MPPTEDEIKPEVDHDTEDVPMFLPGNSLHSWKFPRWLNSLAMITNISQSQKYRDSYKKDCTSCCHSKFPATQRSSDN